MENDHPGSNPLQDHSYMPQGTQKMVTGESAQKSGRPSVYCVLVVRIPLDLILRPDIVIIVIEKK